MPIRLLSIRLSMKMISLNGNNSNKNKLFLVLLLFKLVCMFERFRACKRSSEISFSCMAVQTKHGFAIKL